MDYLRCNNDATTADILAYVDELARDAALYRDEDETLPKPQTVQMVKMAIEHLEILGVPKVTLKYGTYVLTYHRNGAEAVVIVKNDSVPKFRIGDRQLTEESFSKLALVNG